MNHFAQRDQDSMIPRRRRQVRRTRDSGGGRVTQSGPPFVLTIPYLYETKAKDHPVQKSSSTIRHRRAKDGGPEPAGGLSSAPAEGEAAAAAVLTSGTNSGPPSEIVVSMAAILVIHKAAVAASMGQ